MDQERNCSRQEWERSSGLTHHLPVDTCGVYNTPLVYSPGCHDWTISRMLPESLANERLGPMMVDTILEPARHSQKQGFPSNKRNRAHRRHSRNHFCRSSLVWAKKAKKQFPSPAPMARVIFSVRSNRSESSCTLIHKETFHPFRCRKRETSSLVEYHWMRTDEGACSAVDLVMRSKNYLHNVRWPERRQHLVEDGMGHANAEIRPLDKVQKRPPSFTAWMLMEPIASLVVDRSNTYACGRWWTSCIFNMHILQSKRQLSILTNQHYWGATSGVSARRVNLQRVHHVATSYLPNLPTSQPAAFHGLESEFDSSHCNPASIPQQNICSSMDREDTVDLSFEVFRITSWSGKFPVDTWR